MHRESHIGGYLYLAKDTEVMDYLDKYPVKGGGELLKELGSMYDESPAELKSFVDANMQDAIKRDSGKTVNKVSLDESDIKDSIEAFFNENVKESD